MADLMLRPLVNLKASVHQLVFGRILHPVVVFFSLYFCFFTQLIWSIMKHATSESEIIVKKFHCKNF